MTVFDDWDIYEPEYEFKCPLCGHDKYRPIDVVNSSDKIYKFDTSPKGLKKNVRLRERTVTEEKIKEIGECARCTNRIILKQTMKTVSKKQRKLYNENMRKVKFEKDTQVGFLAPEQF
jgi:hypothetical protein